MVAADDRRNDAAAAATAATRRSMAAAVAAGDGLVAHRLGVEARAAERAEEVAAANIAGIDEKGRLIIAAQPSLETPIDLSQGPPLSPQAKAYMQRKRSQEEHRIAAHAAMDAAAAFEDPRPEMSGLRRMPFGAARPPPPLPPPPLCRRLLSLMNDSRITEMKSVSLPISCSTAITLANCSPASSSRAAAWRAAASFWIW
mmetsp:Transcript_41798/g.115237  ORF Transcript_41798/g.115237 Transcript_41798/m.115237 type:complete len:200 (+) Transcript_41798:225-824(+)